MRGALEKRITLEINRTGVQERIPVRQGDSLVHRILISLAYNGRKCFPEGAVWAEVAALLPDGSIVSADCVIGSDGVCTFTPGAGFFTCDGPVLCRLILRGENGGELYSPAFAFDAEPCFAAEGSGIEAKEYSRLEELLLRVLEIKKAYEGMSAEEFGKMAALLSQMETVYKDYGAASDVGYEKMQELLSQAEALRAECEAAADTLRSGAFKTELSDSAPLPDGGASPGTAETAARADHVHPTDTSRMPAMSEITGIMTNPANSDCIPIESSADRTTKRMLFGRLLVLVKDTLVNKAQTALSLADSASSSYRAALPKLSRDETVALARDIAEHDASEVSHADIRAALGEFSSEGWVFELEDGTSVTKTVVIR